MRLFPPRRYWLWLVLGIIFVVFINLVLPIPFLATVLVSLLFAYVAPGPGGKLRKFLMFLFYLGGLELVIIGVLIILGFGLVGAFSAAASLAAALFTLVVGVVLGAIFILIGILLFIIGNFIAD